MTTTEDIDKDDSNYQLFRDCVFEAIVTKSSTTAKTRKKTHPRRRQSQSTGHSSSSSGTATATSGSDPEPDPSELGDFSDYLSSEVFSSLPLPLRTINHVTLKPPSSLSSASTPRDIDADNYSLPLTLSTLESLTDSLPPSVHDTLQAYALTNPPSTDTATFLSPILTSYITHATHPPPAPSATRTLACELCDRDWIPLTYHHLIPKAVHAKVLKRGWHEESKLSSVAWLCRACHSFVHRVASNEELAREWFSVERLREREDVQRWIGWVGGVRWKKR